MLWGMKEKILGTKETESIEEEDRPSTQRFLTPADSFPEQWEPIISDDREIMLMTARQAAKTTTGLLKAIKTATEIPGSRTLYVSFDLATGQELIFEPAQAWLDKMGWKYRANAGGSIGLRIKLEKNGSIIQCRSADDMRSVGRLRGRGWHVILVDELQEYAPEVAKKLIVDVLGATQFRHKGSITLMFTPPDVQAGWLWDEYISGRWKLFGWPQQANPYLPAGEAERWLKKRGLDLSHPIARREILGLWEPNTENLVFDGFNYQINTYNPGPVQPDETAVLPTEFDKSKWVYAIGSDIGWQHDDSIIIGAWNLYDPQRRVYECLTWRQNHQDIDELYLKFEAFWNAHKPVRSIVMDQAGAGGQKVLATIENRFRRMGLPIRLNFKPTSVPASVGLVNDSFRVGRLLLRKDSPLLSELSKTVWKDGTNRQEIDKGKFDPHGLDGLRYMLWGVQNYKAQDGPPIPSQDPQVVREQQIIKQIAEMEARRQTGRWGRRLV